MSLPSLSSWRRCCALALGAAVACQSAAPPGAAEAPAVAAPSAPAPALPGPPALVAGLPVIGVLVYPKVLGGEVFAPLDVFTKPSKEGAKLFNVVTIAQEPGVITTEEGLRILPDHTLADAPALDVLIVPSAYDMDSAVKDAALLDFIRDQNAQTDYTMSNCAGAQLLGAAGVADGRKIVTWIGGGEELQARYPRLLVQDDATVTYVEDGKFLSSNGNLATYVSSLELLEKLSSPAHRAHIEDYLYLGRLQGWSRAAP